jgi:hypothetical protein
MTIRESRVMGKEAILYTILCQLVLEGRTTIHIKRDLVSDALYKGLRISIEMDDNTDNHIVHLSIDGMKARMQDADYEIIDEPAALPQPPKQLTDGHNHDA